MHVNLYRLAFVRDSHATCGVCSRNPRRYLIVRRDIQRLMDERKITITYERDDNEVNMIEEGLAEFITTDDSTLILAKA